MLSLGEQGTKTKYQKKKNNNNPRYKNEGVQICGNVYGKSVIYEYRENLSQGSSAREEGSREDSWLSLTAAATGASKPN